MHEYHGHEDQRKLRNDEDGPHAGNDSLEWGDVWPIDIEVIAGERSWAMAIVVQHQQMFRGMLINTDDSTNMPVEKVVYWCQSAKMN